MKSMKLMIYKAKGGIKVLPFYLFTFLPLAAGAQDSLLLRSYQTVQTADAWLGTPNAAALTRLSAPSIAEADLSLSYASGQLTDYYDSPRVLQAGATVESYYRLSPRTVVYGAMSYDNWTGRDMTGSAFMHVGGRYPFDIVEDSLTNAGRKHRDTYRLSGAVGIDLWRGYSLGARVDYTAANYAKYKDLRHKNKLMDLSLTAGVFAPFTPWLQVGADYTYHRQTESMQFRTYGKSDKVYKSLIDYGAMMGLVEQYGNDGFTDMNNEMPYFEDGHGGALRLEVRPLYSLGGLWQTLSVYGDVALSHATGYYGRRSPYSIAYTNHDRDVLTATARVSMEYGTSRHCLDLSYASEKLQNRAETFRALTNAYGSSYYEYFDPTETADKHWYNLDADYTLDLGIRGERPLWTLRLGYHWQKRQIASYLYPYYRRQNLTTQEVTASVCRNIVMQSGVWTLTASGGFQEGTGDAFIDGVFTAPSSKQTPPATMTAYLYQDYHLLTAPQLSLGLQVQYAFRFPGTRLLTHVRGSFLHRKANSRTNDYCGRDYTTGTLAVGCTF